MNDNELTSRCSVPGLNGFVIDTNDLFGLTKIVSFREKSKRDAKRVRTDGICPQITYELGK